MSGIDRKAANAQALALLKHTRALVEPKPDEQLLAETRTLQIEVTKLLRLMTPAAPIGSKVAIADQVQPDLEALMNDLANVLRELLEPLGFALFVFEFGSDKLFNYISNAHRDDMVATMKEFIAAHEGRRVAPAPEDGKPS